MVENDSFVVLINHKRQGLPWYNAHRISRMGIKSIEFAEFADFAVKKLFPGMKLPQKEVKPIPQKIVTIV